MNSPTRYSAEVRVQSTLAPIVTTLNEGRSLNSGDTAPSVAHWSRPLIAQRRPEPELRRHPPVRRGRAGGRHPLNEGRSLNSGDTPAWSRPARCLASALNEGRSLNSGDTGACTSRDTDRQDLAQRRPEPELQRHSCGVCRPSRQQRPLNEGRSLNSGDTAATDLGLVEDFEIRSTKAGA